MRRVVELTLNRAHATIAIGGDQVDSGVGLVRPIRPVVPQPHVCEALGVHRIRGQISAHQPLKTVSKLAIACAVRSERGEYGLDRRDISLASIRRTAGL